MSDAPAPREKQMERRLRGDLEVHPRRCGGRRQYWIADPISGQVVRLDDADFHQLSHRAGRAGELDPQLASEAAAAGLLALETPRQTPPPRAARWWHHPLYIRLPGIPADGIADWLGDRSNWLFSSRAVGMWLAAVVLATIALVLRWPSLFGSADALVTFQAKHWGFALGTLALTKMLHELAHAAVCRRMGAAAREIGVLLLCGTPCLYCDVTDSWRVDSRTRRAAIMLAGVYVELIIAAGAAAVWMLSDNPSAALAALHIVCLCGVSTLLFNLNPLMRYDGYFVLSDVLDVPNLRTRAAEAWRTLVVRRVAGPCYRSVGVAGTRVGLWGLAAYHAAAALYRLVVLAALGGWIYLVMSRAGLEPLARMALIVLALGLVAGHAATVRGVVAGHGGWSAVPRLRRWGLTAVWCALGVLILWVPVDRRVVAAGAVELSGSAGVYAPYGGRVAMVAVEFGQQVERGETLATLDDPQMRIERTRLSSQIERLRIRRASLRRRALLQPSALAQWEEHSAMISALENQLAAIDRSLAALALVAPRSGTVLPSPDDPASSPREGEPQATGIERLRDRVGQTVEEGRAWCAVGDETHKQVVLEIDAAKRRFVEPGRSVQVRFDQSPAEVMTCRVAEISAMRHDPRATAELLPSNRFAVACSLPEDVAARVRIGTTATGVIHGEPVRLWDWCVKQCFNR